MHPGVAWPRRTFDVQHAIAQGRTSNSSIAEARVRSGRWRRSGSGPARSCSPRRTRECLGSSSPRGCPGSSRSAGGPDRQPDRLHEAEHVPAGAAGSHPRVEPVAVDVQGTEDVADPVLAVVGRAQPLGQPSRGPAGALARFEADRSHLVEADHRPVKRRRGVELEHPGGAGLVVRIRARLPRAGALERQASLGQQPPQVRSARSPSPCSAS